MNPIRHIEFSSDPQGGAFFPGLAKPVVIDMAALDSGEAARLQKLAEDVRFFDQPAVVGTPRPGAADYRYDVLTVDDGTKRHTVRALVPIEDPALRDLFDAVGRHVKAIRAAQRKAQAGGKTGE
ncbi:MAG TPA: protealysin inhibitor emfourin [Noviherbaspirillum sp.]|nr:protealysin inhibitor emfourin [Noviherbaspirillum sp.]